jgi:hypothetical protein
MKAKKSKTKKRKATSKRKGAPKRKKNGQFAKR